VRPYRNIFLFDTGGRRLVPRNDIQLAILQALGFQIQEGRVFILEKFESVFLK
jgi:hypothetical protein